MEKRKKVSIIAGCSFHFQMIKSHEVGSIMLVIVERAVVGTLLKQWNSQNRSMSL
jgi:hypothetical protein